MYVGMDPILSTRCGVAGDVDTTSRMRRLAVATLVAALLPAAPAVGAELEPLKPCYVSAGAEEAARESIHVRAHGFTPYAEVVVLLDGVEVVRTPTDAVGYAEATVAAPYREQGEGEVVLTMQDPVNPAAAVIATTRVTALTTELSPARAQPSERVRFRGRGCTGDRGVYAHYLLRGRERRTVRLAKPRGACGTFSVRRRQIPVRRPDTGRWLVQVDQKRRYSEAPGTNWVRLLIRVRRVFRDV